MPIDKVQNVICQLNRRPGVRLVLDAFGDVLNGFGAKYATGYTRNKALLHTARKIPIHPAEIERAEEQLLANDRLKSYDLLTQHRYGEEKAKEWVPEPEVAPQEEKPAGAEAPQEESSPEEQGPKVIRFSGSSEDTPEFVLRTQALMATYGYEGMPIDGWMWGTPMVGKKLTRGGSDWRIMVNPREEHYFEVLEGTLSVLSTALDLGIEIRTSRDLAAKWRPGRRFGATSDAPKITIFVNEDLLPGVLSVLNEALEPLKSGGFGKRPGPSYARRIGITDMLFYQREYWSVEGEDARAKIAASAKKDAKKALETAGFCGENYYRRAEDADPFEVS
jgi:hypothetical protein